MSDLASRVTEPNEKKEDTVAAADVPATDATAGGQADGTVEELGGSGLQEPEWDVEISLSELQQNEATPFHSAQQWDDLGLYENPFEYHRSS